MFGYRVMQDKTNHTQTTALMLFPLKNIEANVNDRFFIIGETLYEQGKVTDLSEAEKHLWLANVVGNEVEVQITPSKVRACTCECERYKEEEMCEHITAVLLKLRRELDRVKTAKAQQRVKRNSVAKKLTTAVILDHISTDELKHYVRDYAKSNRAFGLALKARFAASVPMADDREKFFQLLETTIKDARTKHDRIRYKGKLKLLKILKELLAQVDDYIASEKFTDAFYILQAIIEKCAPLYWKVEGDASKYYGEIKRSFNLLQNLLESNPAPAMREDIWHFCLAECGKSTYRLSGFSQSFFQILLDLADDREKEDELVQVIDSQVDSLTIGGKSKASLLIHKLNILERQNQDEAAEKLVFENLSEPDLLLFVTEKALEKKNYIRARFLAEQSFKHNFPIPIVSKMEEVLLSIAQAENKPKEIKDFARRKLLRKKEIVDYELLKEAVDDADWSDFITTFLEELAKKPYSMEKRDLIAEIHARENNFSALLDYIENIRSLDLLQRYDVLLMEEEKERVNTIYEDILNSFIRHHLGRQSSEKIRLALQHLHDIGARKLARDLTKKFRTHYPERFTLIEELARL